MNLRDKSLTLITLGQLRGSRGRSLRPGLGHGRLNGAEATAVIQAGVWRRKNDLTLARKTRSEVMTWIDIAVLPTC